MTCTDCGCDLAAPSPVRDCYYAHASPHAKGRDCARTEEVLENYRKRAVRAEARLARREEAS